MLGKYTIRHKSTQKRLFIKTLLKVCLNEAFCHNLTLYTSGTNERDVIQENRREKRQTKYSNLYILTKATRSTGLLIKQEHHLQRRVT